MTNTDGIATVQLDSRYHAGNRTRFRQAIAGGIPPVSFNATAAALPATAIAINAAMGSPRMLAQAVPIAPSVKVTDAEGVGVPGVSVTFSRSEAAAARSLAPTLSPMLRESRRSAAGLLGLGGNSSVRFSARP